MYRQLAERCAALAADPARRAAEAAEVWAMIWAQGSRRDLLAPAPADERFHAEWAKLALPRYPRPPAVDPGRPATLPAAHRRIRELLEENGRLHAELARLEPGR